MTTSTFSMNPVDYYIHQGCITNPGEYIGLLNELPTEISELCRVVQGILIHVYFAEHHGKHYGVTFSKEREHELDLRHTTHRLRIIQELDARPLTVTRAGDVRSVGTCRDFATLLCSILRHQGVPARVRCGFGTYFGTDAYEDHWVCEYWKSDEECWVMVDAQLDAFLCDMLKIAFDPCDVPPDQFLTGGKAWQLCRNNQVDPKLFGFFDMRGMWFIRGDLVRDFASLNKMELLPWDCWGLILGEDKDISEHDMALLDHIAALTLEVDANFSTIRKLYEQEDGLRVPSLIKSYSRQGVQMVELPTQEF